MKTGPIVHYPCLDTNPYNARLAQSLQQVGIDIERRPPASHSNPARSLSWAWRARLVHFHWMQGLYSGRTTWRFLLRASWCLAILIMLRLSGTRLVLTVHNLVPHEHTHRRLHQAMHRALGRVMHQLVVHSKAAAGEVAREYGVPRRRIAVIEHVDYGAPAAAITRREARRLLRLPATRKLLLLFGSIRPYKGVDRLLTAAADLDTIGYDIVIAGRPATDALGSSLEAAARRHRNLHLRLGELGDATLSACLLAADLVIFPYRSGLSSGAAHLALSHGRPFICSRSTAFDHFIEAGIGLPIEADGPAALVGAVGAAERIDCARWEAAVAHYRQRCGLDLIGARLKTLYADLLTDRCDDFCAQPASAGAPAHSKAPR